MLWIPREPAFQLLGWHGGDFLAGFCGEFSLFGLGHGFVGWLGLVCQNGLRVCRSEGFSILFFGNFLAKAGLQTCIPIILPLQNPGAKQDKQATCHKPSISETN